MESLQLTFTKEADCLKARHFFHLEVRFAGTNIHERFDFKTWTVNIKVGKTASPEGIVAIAEIGKLNSEACIGKEIDKAITKLPYPRKIFTGAIMDKARSFRKICALHQGINEMQYLTWIMGSIAIHHHDHLPGRCR